MRFTRVVGFVRLALIAIAFYSNQPLVLNIVIVLSLAYVVYGLAVTHGLVLKLGVGSGWLAMVYALLVIVPPQVMMLLSLLGLADIWVDFRSRFART